MSARNAGNLAFIKILVERGANVDRQSEAGPPLLWATSTGCLSAVKALLAAGADPNLRGHNNITAAIMAAATGVLMHRRAILLEDNAFEGWAPTFGVALMPWICKAVAALPSFTLPLGDFKK